MMKKYSFKLFKDILLLKFKEKFSGAIGDARKTLKITNETG